MVTFPVDDVVPAAEPLPTRPLRELFPEALVTGGDPSVRVLAPDGVHPLIGAVATAHAEHRPLVLSPDAVWLTIAAGVAQHVRLNAELLRPLLVEHPGRKRLTVVWPGPMPLDAESWGAIAGELADQVKPADLFLCDFSTSTAVDRIAAQIVTLDAYSPYYAYWVTFLCGIPEITLTGTAEDWRRIRGRIDDIATLDLDQWCRSLGPILDEFVRAAEGRPDTAFWQRIFSPVDAYGGEVVTGWIARFYPYLLADGIADKPNNLLELPVGEPRDVTTTPHGSYYGPGVSTADVPATLSRVVIHTNDRSAGTNGAVALHAGLAAVAQDAGGALRPIAGWHLTAAPIAIDDVLDRIVEEHETTPPAERRAWSDGGPDVQAIDLRFGSATLFDGRWRILPRDSRPIDFAGDRMITGVIALEDGRHLSAVDDHQASTTHWIICRMGEVDPQSPVFGTSLAALLQAALDEDGEIAHLRTGHLHDLPAAR
jgi:hypothetical protein